MGSIAARHARTVLEHVERIVAIELVVAAQALELRMAADTAHAGAPGAGVAEALRRIRLERSPPRRRPRARPGPRRRPRDRPRGRPRRPGRTGTLTARGWRRGGSVPCPAEDESRPPAVDLCADGRHSRGRRRGRRDLPAVAAVRRPRFRSPLVRLLGGCRSGLEGGAARVAGTGARPARTATRHQPRPRPANPFLADLEAAGRPPQIRLPPPPASIRS